MRHVVIGIVSLSPVITAGLSAILSESKEVDTVSVAPDNPDIRKFIDHHRISALIVDPASAGSFTPASLPDSIRSRIAAIAICISQLPKEMARAYDAVLSIYDTADTITATIKKLTETDAGDEKPTELSSREKEVVTGIVKGMSNKEIADHLNVSVNTVMTHRRNISAKLQIHSPAGLTIYAIVSKLVNIDDIKTDIS